MGKMTEETFSILYEYGKKVYKNEMTSDEAAKKANKENHEVAVSSAKHYITWYSRMRKGEFLTWNTNCQLLLYYVNRIIVEEGKDAGIVALNSAKKYAKHAGRIDLEEELTNIERDRGLCLSNTEKEYGSWEPSLEDYSPGITKEKWKELILDQAIFLEKNLLAMACIYDNGGEGSCTELATKYGQDMTLWRTSCGVHLASRVADATHCRLLQTDGKTTYFVIPFLYKKTDSGQVGSYIYKLRPELEAALKEVGIEKYLPEKKVENNIKESLDIIKDFIASKGFYYSGSLIENFYLSLKSKPFVILAGTSGTGKTRLVKLFAEAIGAKYKLVPVRPDWSDGSDLFGHYDINGNFIKGPVCSAFEDAINEPNKPVFLCLDEMNLARVEYYFSDFLSVIESRDKKAGHIVTESIAQYENGIPENLYIIGTVNMDETTFPFSRKVLDRANTIEFNYVDLIPQQRVKEHVEPKALDNSFLRTEYLILANDCADEADFAGKICAELQVLNEILVKANAHVGYRVRDEIVFYMLNNKKAGDLITYNQAMDNEIMQKILPRIQGSSAAIKKLLIELFEFCRGRSDAVEANTGSVGDQMRKIAASENDIKYPESAKKISYMMSRFEDDGFTSYWL